METFIAIVAILFGIVGIIGSVAPALPGPPLSWVGLLVLYIWGSGTNGSGEPVSTTLLLVWLGIVIVVSILDYFVPAYFTKVTGGSRAGGRTGRDRGGKRRGNEKTARRTGQLCNSA